MSNLQYPDLQIWKNNAAFEDSQVKLSWSSLNGTTNTAFLDSEISKENRRPCSVNRQVSGIIKPVKSNGNVVLEKKEEVKDRDLSKIDADIEDVEKEIKRLTSRLDGLRLEKLAQSVKILEKRGKGKVVAAKFMETKQSVKNKGEDLFGSRTNRRGVSLGPAEIFGSTRQVGRPEIASPLPISNRRQSCFWKLQEVDEVRAIKERGKSFSVSPKSRREMSKINGSKQALTTAGTKKAVKKGDWMVCPIQPKRLFNDGEKSIPAKKNIKPVRKVASRYSLGGTGQAIGNSAGNTGGKNSVLENDKSDGKQIHNRIAAGTERTGKEAPIKKNWDGPSEIVVYKGDVIKEEEFSPSVGEVVDALPRIRTDRCVNETPRDSGPAKRVAELIGKKSFFSSDEEIDISVFQALDFAADE